MKPFSACRSFANRLHLHWAAHYSRVTGKPSPSGFTFTLYDAIAQLPLDLWDSVNNNKDIFLSTAYLSALEQAPPANMKFRYAVVRKNSAPVGIAYFQIVELGPRLHKSPLQLLTAAKRSLLQDIHNRIADTAVLRLLVCGNVMISGEHGFSMPAVSNESALRVVAEIAYALRKLSNPPITVTLIKDFYQQEASSKNILSRFGYHSFDAGPNMVIPIRRNWTTFDNYTNEMKSKYRKRVTSAIKKGAAILRQSFDLDDIVRYRDELFTLYCQVVDKAKFKIFFLSPDYFAGLKRHLGGKFVCEGYFSSSTLIGFTTRIINGDTLEVYSHGVRYEYNKEFELYQNFLLDDVRAAIAGQSLYVNTGRTSAAMKSSVGAIPKDIVCYMRFSGGHSNQFLKPLFYFIKSSGEYCRNPFED